MFNPLNDTHHAARKRFINTLRECDERTVEQDVMKGCAQVLLLIVGTLLLIQYLAP